MTAGVKVALVDYDDKKSVVAALRDQQFLVITLGVRAPPDRKSARPAVLPRLHLTALKTS